MTELTNPYLPGNVYIPDGEPRVYGDRVYLYGSHDLNGTRFPCEGDYECWSAPVSDLTQWRSEGTIYHRLQDSFIRRHCHDLRPFGKYLFAPDVVKVAGRWYLYYGVGMSGAGIGVAVASSPVGPFAYLGRVRYPNGKPLGEGRPLFTMPLGIPHFHKAGYPYDPALLYDQGRLFLYFGYGHCYLAELSTSDMRTMVRLPENGHFVSTDLLAGAGGWPIENAPSIRKIKGRYYLTYYAKHKRCHALCYATSSTPIGPFAYQGVLLSLGNLGVGDVTKPTAYQGNTHGGLFWAAGHYYQSYHRQTGGRFPDRQACLAELVMDKQGRFKTVEFKSQVKANGGLDWFRKYLANTACVLVNRHGRCRKRHSPCFGLQGDQQVVTNLVDGGVVGFKYLDFRAAPRQQKVTVWLAHARAGRIDVLVGRERQLAGTIEPRPGRTRFSAPVRVPQGIQAVYFRLWGLRGACLVAFKFSAVR